VLFLIKRVIQSKADDKEIKFQNTFQSVPKKNVGVHALLLSYDEKIV